MRIYSPKLQARWEERDCLEERWVCILSFSCWFSLVRWCLLYYVSLNFHLRSFYPKTTVPMALDFDPVFFRSVADTYKWASTFVNRVAQVLGPSWVAQRLSKWKWNLSTAFSGVGCAEMVRILELAAFHLTLNLYLSVLECWSSIFWFTMIYCPSKACSGGISGLAGSFAEICLQLSVPRGDYFSLWDW